MEIYVALARAGLVAVPINFRLVGRGDRVHRRRTARRARSSCRTTSSTASSRSAPTLAHRARRASSTSAAEAAPAGWHAYEALLAQRRADDARRAVVAPEDTWALMYTSGTTGKPKGAIRNHAGSALISLVTALDMGSRSATTRRCS